MKRAAARKDYITIVMGIALIGMMVFRLVMGKLVGDKGMACFGSANEIYFIVAGTISYGLSEAVASLVRYRVRREQYKSAQRVFGGAVLIGSIIGSFWDWLFYLWHRGLQTESFICRLLGLPLE